MAQSRWINLNQAGGHNTPPDPPPPALDVITASDFTFDGAFMVPDSCDFGAGIMGRYDGATLLLYSFAQDGTLKEYTVPTLTLTAPFNKATQTNDYGDIFQNVITRAVDNGGGGTQPPPNLHGLANARPSDGFIDPVSGEMVWTTAVDYNNTGDDTMFGTSTLNHVAHTGTGQETYKFSVTYGGRFSRGCLPIPSAFLTDNPALGTRRIAVVAGGAMSIISNKFSLGPAMFATVKPDPAVEPSEDYLTTLPMPLVAYLSGTPSYRAPRPAALATLQAFPDAYTGTTGYWNWVDGYSCALGAIWPHGTLKAGAVFFCPISLGPTATITVSASPAPIHGVFTVNDASTLKVGDVIGVRTDTTVGQEYPFCYGRISGIASNAITWTSIRTASLPQDPDNTGIPIAASALYTGAFYIGGGTMATRYVNAMYIYSETQLASVVNDVANIALTPNYMGEFDLGGQPTYFPGAGPSLGDRIRCLGAWLDDSAKKAYVMYDRFANATNPVIFRYSVNY